MPALYFYNLPSELFCHMHTSGCSADFVSYIGCQHICICHHPAVAFRNCRFGMYSVQFIRDDDFIVIILVILIILCRVWQNENHSAIIVTVILMKPLDHACSQYVKVTVSAQIELHIFLRAEQFLEQFM